MSKWSEYLALLPKGLKNPSQVIEGIVNSVSMSSLPEEEKDEIIRRRLLCASCKYMSSNREDYHTKRTDEHCTLCSCPILTKTASLSSDCGAKAYNLSHPGDQKPVLWEKYKK